MGTVRTLVTESQVAVRWSWDPVQGYTVALSVRKGTCPGGGHVLVPLCSTPVGVFTAVSLPELIDPKSYVDVKAFMLS